MEDEAPWIPLSFLPIGRLMPDKKDFVVVQISRGFARADTIDLLYRYFIKKSILPGGGQQRGLDPSLHDRPS